ncbi:MAG: NAD+ synthase [Paracoccaceae bacterium]|jgi:NAD+ synthase
MSATFRLILAQFNPSVGALMANGIMAREAWEKAKAQGADLLAFPEMFITGYQAQDLILKKSFVLKATAEIAKLAVLTADGPAIAIGGPHQKNGCLYNAYYILQGGKIDAVILKHHLPNNEVFDEKRIFVAADICGPYRIGPLRIGSPICEDAWNSDVTETLAESGAALLLVPNGSPYHRGKLGLRQNLMVARVIETGLPAIYLNMVGGQDDQLFDGASFALNPKGELAVQLLAFEEQLAVIDLVEEPQGWRIVAQALALQPSEYQADYHAMVLSLRDYLAKTGFSKVVLGLSGGIDSSLVATIAADAIGPQNVQCYMLPSIYTSVESLQDADELTQNLGVGLETLSISKSQVVIETLIAPFLPDQAPAVTHENIQSRLRGLLLMALSNATGAMVLTTGNKSEVAVGYCTIYGDMNGGFNPIKDLYKTRVFDMCRWRNVHHLVWMQGSQGAVIPERIIEKPPSAELRPDHRDDDNLPPYEVLDPILEAIIEDEKSLDEICALGFDPQTIKRVENLIMISEYKRFQSAPGTKLTRKAFWLDRRYPIANLFRDANDS